MYNGLVTSGWECIKFEDYTLIEGDHTFAIGYREDGAKLDKICISNYLETPEGIGEEAENICDPTGVKNSVEIIEGYSLEQNYPNSFNPCTQIEFQILNDEHVTISVYNTLGQQVATLVDRELARGTHNVTFNAINFSSGIYFYSIKTEGFS